jgi:hypothetical protein
MAHVTVNEIRAILKADNAEWNPTAEVAGFYVKRINPTTIRVSAAGWEFPTHNQVCLDSIEISLRRAQPKHSYFMRNDHNGGFILS